MKIFRICIAILITISLQAQTYTLDSTVLNSRNVITGIDIPWEIIWGPDDFIWMTERFGRVSRVNPSNGQQTVILNLSSSVYQQSESGLLGMALHPDFSNQPYVFLVYTYLSGNNILEKMVRYYYNGSSLVNPQTFIENIPANTTHDGSRLLILTDSTLIMTTGDAQNTSAVQNVNSMNGKVLRFNLDGSIPSDNPKPNSYVYSWGHRNAQGLCLGPNNIIYSSEHGPTTDDELHIISKSGNFGWPNIVGDCDAPNETVFCADSNVIEPLASWTPTIAPSDLIWYNHPSIPEFNNKLLMTVLKDKRLIAFELNSSGNTVLSENHYLTNINTRLRDICVSPDGKIYLATNGSSWSNTSPYTHKIIELSNQSYIPSNVEITETDKQIIVWPNPIQKGEQLNIKIEEIGKCDLSLFDQIGRIIHSSEFEKNISIQQNFESGLYFYVLTKNGKTIKTGKFSVK
jgi:glucose/arabinose dehydrogenase